MDALRWSLIEGKPKQFSKHFFHFFLAKNLGYEVSLLEAFPMKIVEWHDCHMLVLSMVFREFVEFVSLEGGHDRSWC